MQCLLFESRSHAVLLANDSLPPPRSFPEIRGLVRYIDEVFQRDGPSEEILGAPYPTIAWAETVVIFEQEVDGTKRPLLPPQYLVETLRLPEHRHVPDNLSSISQTVQTLLGEHRNAQSNIRSILETLLVRSNDRTPDRSGRDGGRGGRTGGRGRGCRACTGRCSGRSCPNTR